MRLYGWERHSLPVHDLSCFCTHFNVLIALSMSRMKLLKVLVYLMQVGNYRYKISKHNVVQTMWGFSLMLRAKSRPLFLRAQPKVCNDHEQDPCKDYGKTR